MIGSDVIVVGAGVMGAATARALAHAGAGVTILERFALGHKRGSSHGRSRIFRLSYPDALYVDMAAESRGLWRAIEAESGRALLITTGALDTGYGVETNAGALESCGIAFELLEGRACTERFPQIRFADDELALFQADAGILAADDAVRTLAESAVANGARLVEETTATTMEPRGDLVEVRAGGETFRAPVVVVTAGAWAKDLLAQVDVELDVRPTRETVAYFPLDGPLPPSLVEWGSPAIYSLASPGHGLKVGRHVAGPTTRPDDPGVVDEDSVATVARWVARRWAAARPQPLLAETCIYTNTPDESFVLERHGSIVVGSPCSGHGFKFAPLIGKRLAALALEA